MDDRKLKILFHLLHPGYARNYDSTIRLLASRGHDIVLASPADRLRDGGGLNEVIAGDCQSVETSAAPERDRRDPWWHVAWWGRVAADAARFLDPRYASAPLLRERPIRRLEDRLPRIDGTLAGRAVSLLVRRMRGRPSRRLSASLVRVLRRVERGVPTTPAVDGFIGRIRPDVVLVTPLVNIGSAQTDVVKSAKRAGIPVAVCVASWDNLTNKGLIRGEPDEVYLWNERQADEAVSLHDIPRDAIVVTGAQRFDFLFDREPSETREAFLDRTGMPTGTRFLLYVCSSAFIAPNEVDFVRRWLSALRAHGSGALRDLPVLIRPHPQNPQPWEELSPIELGPFSVWPAAGVDPVDAASQKDFFESIAHSEGVVGINTSAMVEAAILGRSTFSLLVPEHRSAQEGTLHFRHLLAENGGFLHVAQSFDEHCEQLKRQLAGGLDDADRLRRFVEQFVRPAGLDVPATPILADAIERLARRPTRPDTPSQLDRALAVTARALFAVPVSTGAVHARAGSFVRSVRRSSITAPVRAAGRPLVVSFYEQGGWRGVRARLPRRSQRPLFAPKRQAQLALVARAEGTRVVFGPWVGPPELELLYWAPFVRWVVRTFALSRAEVTILTETGPVPWYDDVAADVRVPGAAPRTAGAVRLDPSVLADVWSPPSPGRSPFAPLRHASEYVRAGTPDRPVNVPERYVVVDPRPTATCSDWSELLAGCPQTLDGVAIIHLDEAADDVAAADAVVAHAEGVIGSYGLVTQLGIAHGIPTLALYDDTGALNVTAAVTVRAAAASGAPLLLLERGAVGDLGYLLRSIASR